MGSQSKRKKGTKDNRSIVSDIKRETDQDANRTALQPTFEGLAYSPVGISQTDYVDVTDTIDPLQTNAPTAPAQVTGLDVLTGSTNNSLNLIWTASPSPGVTYYNIYRSTTSGAEVLVNSTSSTSFIDTGLQGATRYYYKISAVNNAGIEGALSVEDSVITTGTLPAQITGLSVAVIGDMQLNLSWTASSASGLLYYNIYRSNTTGTEVLVDTSFTNSYNDLTVSPGTTYYYKVAAINDVGTGTLSAEASATTTGSAPTILPNLWLKFDGNYNDSATPANTVTAFNSSGFLGSGKFGTNAVKLNDPAAGTDHIEVTANSNINIDMAGKWSFSCWIYSLTTGGFFFCKTQSANNFTRAQLYFGDLQFDVTEGGTSFGKQSGSLGTFPLNSWHHVVGTWDGTTNTIMLYLDKVSQTSTFTGGITSDNSNLMIGGRTSGGNRFDEYEGRVDEFQLFKGVILTQTNVNNLYSSNQA
jgi:Concanavalin A-like lectin/glucanases superfamily/Fibronectin type III domain